MNNIKAIVFDIGGVLYEELEHSKIIKKYNLEEEKFRYTVRKYLEDAILGKLGSFEFIKCIANDLNVSPRKFFKDWVKERENLKVNKELKNIIKKLKKNYKIAAFTNIIKSSEIDRKKKRVYEHFHLKIKSIDYGLKKPDVRFYKLLIKKLSLKPDEIIFVDDSKGNLIPAKKLGIKTILFKNNNRLIRDLRRFGVKI